jgi:uncharacterized membrane protein
VERKERKERKREMIRGRRGRMKSIHNVFITVPMLVLSQNLSLSILI